MADITINNERVPIPMRERNGHEPSPGDIYIYKDTSYPKIVKIKDIPDEYHALVLLYNFDSQEWDEEESISLSDIRGYYTLVLGNFFELWLIATYTNSGDDSLLKDILDQAKTDNETMALVASRPTEQILSLTEAGERLKDKLETVRSIMEQYHGDADRAHARTDGKKSICCRVKTEKSKKIRPEPSAHHHGDEPLYRRPLEVRPPDDGWSLPAGAFRKCGGSV